MSFCSNCGTELTEGTAFCPNCGAGQVRQFDVPEQTVPTPQPEIVPVAPVDQDPAPVYQQPVYSQTVDTSATALTGVAKIFSIISMACGIASIPLCCSGPTLGIAAIVFSILARKKTPAGVSNTMAKVGRITGIIGVALGVIALIVSFVSGLVNGYQGFQESFQYVY